MDVFIYVAKQEQLRTQSLVISNFCVTLLTDLSTEGRDLFLQTI